MICENLLEYLCGRENLLRVHRLSIIAVALAFRYY